MNKISGNNNRKYKSLRNKKILRIKSKTKTERSASNLKSTKRKFPMFNAYIDP